DKTVDFIHEWTPRDLNMYIKWIIPCWIFGLGSLILVRRSIIFSSILLLIFGFLSFQAIRHEPFFVITALFLTSYQISYSEKFKDIFSSMERRIWPCALYLSIIFLIVFCAAHSDKFINSIRLGRDGYGAYEPLAGSYEFLENENIEGNMFNNYEAGSYLLFKGYPNRKVFVDGRNIEYGYSFLKDLFASGSDFNIFRKLEKKYNFTHAVIQFDYYKELENLPYISVFETMPNWDLVYIDDYSAVYSNNTSNNNLFVYKVITPNLVLFPTRILQIPSSLLNQLNKEIDYALGQSPDFSNFRLRLAKASLFFVNGDLKSSESIINNLREKEPNRFEPVNLLAMIRTDQEKYLEAGELFEMAIKLGGGEDFISMDYDFLSSLFDKGGDGGKAMYYQRKAVGQ
ncbi:MAG: hypothetical protein KAS32_29820, partial [Candidatus Peribacteraceae bacterium]|nr:hypothetical protein [Candidatus Peribacteraceae bacterium]